MVARSRIDALEQQIDALQRERHLEPLQRWIAMQPTPTLERLRDLMSAGYSFPAALETLQNAQHPDT